MPRRSKKQQKALAKPRHQHVQGEKESRLVAFSQGYAGPIPPPELLAKFDEVVPGAADRIIRDFEAQTAHRHGLENRVVNADIFRANWGLVFGFVLAATALVGSIVLLTLGRTIDGFGLVLLDVGVLAGSFLVSRRQRDRQLAEQE